ncbi:hypothetical protein G5I_00425 [Acromyrmex echinatior]|uniref:Uncharacterized protein n=1 Tax=Acromyrmex echinatior TaxID=103372 RepID=F4W4U8_ACREC|nr:hypothetical protein G5I_00425 [Acromyrmex echinatior]
MVALHANLVMHEYKQSINRGPQERRAVVRNSKLYAIHVSKVRGQYEILATSIHCVPLGNADELPMSGGVGGTVSLGPPTIAPSQPTGEQFSEISCSTLETQSLDLTSPPVIDPDIQEILNYSPPPFEE